MDPQWLPEAHGGLVVFAITALPLIGWAYRTKWYGWIAWGGSGFAIVLVLYYTVRGRLPALIAPSGWSIPQWATLSIACVLGLLVGWLFRSLSQRVGAAAPASTPAAPEPKREPPRSSDPQSAHLRNVWNGLTPREKATLGTGWLRVGCYVTESDVEGIQRQIGMAKWNETLHSLLMQHLLEHEGYGQDYVLTGLARAMMVQQGREGW